VCVDILLKVPCFHWICWRIWWVLAPYIFGSVVVSTRAENGTSWCFVELISPDHYINYIILVKQLTFNLPVCWSSAISVTLWNTLFTFKPSNPFNRQIEIHVSGMLASFCRLWTIPMSFFLHIVFLSIPSWHMVFLFSNPPFESVRIPMYCF
jgi:hypothetical protein